MLNDSKGRWHKEIQCFQIPKTTHAIYITQVCEHFATWHYNLCFIMYSKLPFLPDPGVSGVRSMGPGGMFLNSSLACVTTHVLARVITHVLAQSSGQFELACVATHVLARVATHVLGHVSIPITYLHCHQGHWCGQTRGRPWVSSSGISHMLVLLSQSLSSPAVNWLCS